MASAVVGALRVILEANATQLESEFGKATIRISQFDKFTENAGQRLQRMVEQFSGQRIVTEAVRMSAAIEKVGGVAALTDKELARVRNTVGEATEKLRAMGVTAPQSLANLQAELGKVTNVSNEASISFGKLVGSFVTAQAAIGAAKSAYSAYVGLIESSVESFANAEAAQKKLNAALTSQGNATPEVRDQYNKLATQFENTTVFADDLINEMEALLVQVGDVAPSQMQSALQAATDLASGLGIDLRTATMLVGKAFEGETGTLKRYGIVIDEAKLKTEGVTAVLDAVQQKFGGQAQAEAASYAGQLKQIANAWDNVKESIGKLIVTAPEVQVALANINAVLKDMTRESGTAETTVGKLWQAWERYIELGRTLTPGLAAWNRLLVEQADAAERARMAASIPAPKLPTPPGLPNIGAEGLKVFDELNKKQDEAKKAAEAFKKAQDALFGRDLIARASDLARQLGDVANVTKLTTEKKAELRTAIEKALDVYKALGLTAPKVLQDIVSATTEVIKVTRSFSDVASGVWVPLKPIIEDTRTETMLLVDSLNEYVDAEGRARGMIATLWVPLKKAVAEVRPEIDDNTKATRTWREQLSDLSGAFAELAQISDGALSGILRDIGQVISAINLAGKAGDTLKEGITAVGKADSFKSAVSGLSQIATGALAAAAAIGQATAHGNTLMRTLGGFATGAQAGSAFGPLGTIIGGAAGALTGLLRGLFGVSDAVLKSREDLQKFQETLRGGLTDTQKLEAGTDAWKQDVILVRDAYLATGRTEAEALAITRQLWDTNNPERVKSAIDQINLVLAEEKQKAGDAAAQLERQTKALEDAKSGAHDLVDELAGVVESSGLLPSGLDGYIQRLTDAGLLTDDDAKKLAGLATTANTVSFQKMNDAIELFHGRVESLGPAFQQARIDQLAAQYVNALDVIARGTKGDIGGALQDAREELSALVQDAIRNRSTLPDNLRPFIQNLSDTGQLLDENGEAIRDLGQIHFGPAIKTEAEIAQAAFEKLADRLEQIFQHLEDSLDHLTADRTIDIKINVDDSQLPRGGDGTFHPTSTTEPLHLAAGGTVMDIGSARPFRESAFANFEPVDWRTRGTDSIPAMLSKGEVVVPHEVVSRVEQAASALSGQPAEWPSLPQAPMPPRTDYSLPGQVIGRAGGMASTNTTIVAVPILIEKDFDLRSISDHVATSVREALPTDFAFDRNGLATALVPVIVDRIKDQVRR